jgi:hypothetical protein
MASTRMAFPRSVPENSLSLAALFAYCQFPELSLLLVKKTKCFAVLPQRHYLAYPYLHQCGRGKAARLSRAGILGRGAYRGR